MNHSRVREVLAFTENVLAPVFVHLLFWSWHAIWLLGVVFGLAPELVPALLLASFEGEIPWDITASALGLMAMPCLTLAAGMRLRHDHRKLFRLFYGVGGVAFSLLTFRLFLVREATPGVVLLLVTLAAGVAFYTAELFGATRRVTGRAGLAWMLGYTALLVIGVYLGVTAGLYAIPGIVLTVPAMLEALARAVGSMTFFGTLEGIAYSPFILVTVVFAVYSFTLVLGLPFMVPLLYTRAWLRGFQAFARTRRDRALALVVSAATVALWGLSFAYATRQPQTDPRAHIDEAPTSLAEQAERLAHAERIRAGLLNGYLASYRYWGARAENVQLARLYREAFCLDGDWMPPQHLFNVLAAPLLYDGESMHAEREQAAVRYEQFFDRPLQDAERETVLAAISATYERTQAEAGLLDVGQRKVWLRAQHLDVEAHGDVARFTLHEVYENQTFEQQEVFYSFNLPERAAVTALWLGDGEDLDRRFRHVVAPRGAAQAIYRAERDRRVDPALLEQVGPRQYRLRAFPIPARTDAIGTEVAPLHLWLEWTVLSDGAAYPLPALAEARNVFSTARTERTVNGERSVHEGWLPQSLPADPKRAHALAVGDVLVRATPADLQEGVPAGRLAIVLDTSLSMQAHADRVDAALRLLTRRGAAADLYVAPSPWSAETPRRISLADADPHYYGGHSLPGVLAQFDALRGDRAYAAIIVLSDAGSFAFMRDPTHANEADPNAPAILDATRFDAPVWLVHFGGLPHAYRDDVGDLLQRSRGGVATELEDVLARLQDGPVDGYRWAFERTAPDTAVTPTPDERAFAPIAARAAIAHLSGTMDLTTLSELDAIHALAVRHSVVTPWSSMLVLVDDEQRRRLEQASDAEDRFDREAENGVETPSSPVPTLELSATPEPEEWALLFLVAAAAIVMLRRARTHDPLAA